MHRDHIESHATEPNRGDNGLVEKASKKNTKHRQIKWDEWWPFTRATGDALRQLNRKEPKASLDMPEALL
jgi:hypothetical protein